MVLAISLGLPTMLATHSRSPPAEKAWSPAPVMTATLVLASSLTTAQILVSSQCRRPLVAFITSGRLMVITSTPFGL